jgi:hypothetical protein
VPLTVDRLQGPRIAGRLVLLLVPELEGSLCRSRSKDQRCKHDSGLMGTICRLGDYRVAELEVLA